MADGQVVFEITADGKHAIADIKEVTRAIETESKKWDKTVDESSTNFTKSMARALDINRLKDWTLKAGQMLIDFGKKAIEAASDLAEVQNVVDVTFGSDAGKIDRWAKSAGEQFGLTETQAKKFTSTLGAMMKSSGLAGNEITDMSTDLAGLAADMASFYNLDFDTAFQKIRSGISGETEPLKQLGVNMSVANLEAFALQKGLSKTFSEMTQGEQVMLRYQYLMQATADAQGDFARTSDEYANSRRQLETNIESLTTKIGELLIPKAKDAIGWINNMIDTLTQSPTTTVLDDFAEIDLKTAQKLAEIQQVKQEANILSDVLDEVFGKKNENGDVIDNTITDTVAKLGVKSDEAHSYLEGLGFSTDEINEKQESWLETCRRLVGTIPGLSSIINVETGEVKGGTDAVRDYVKAWEEGQTKLAMLGALEQKKNAISERFADLPGLQLDMAVAEKRVRDNRKAIDDLLKKYGITDYDYTSFGGFSSATVNEYGITEDDATAINNLIAAQADLRQKEQEATDAFNLQNDALKEATVAMEEYEKTVDEMPDGLQNATEAIEDYGGKTVEQWTEITNAVNDTVKALSDYVQGVHDATAASVNSTLNGFNDIKTAAQTAEEAANELEDFRKELEESGNYTAKEIEIKVNAKNAQITLNTLTESLEHQLAYIEEYQNNLKRARELGVSDKILAELSDGSEDSAMKLHAMVEAYQDWDSEGVPEDIKKLNDLWEKVGEGKEQFTDTLTQQKLTVDETYKAMLQTAQETIAKMDLGKDAATASGNTIDGIATGIRDHVSEVSGAVDMILSELNRLSSWGISLDFGQFGSIPMRTGTSGSFTVGQYETGLDWVPFDGFLASLHEGESILTAEENRIWQRFKNGQTGGIDYDALGGTMRDNIQPGGNVYLDGRVVGAVISQNQGNQYRSLQRSGWQG